MELVGLILAIVTITTDQEKDKDFQNKVSQILNKTYQMCVLVEEIESQDSKKKTLLESPGSLPSQWEQMDGILDKISFGINLTLCQKV